MVALRVAFPLKPFREGGRYAKPAEDFAAPLRVRLPLEEDKS
jgi:hypothetical protein